MNGFEKQKYNAALSSVFAAVGLTGFKIVVGVLTGSLGILAEAAHSGLDLAAAAMTCMAVRISGRPADRDHLYGHGRVENLSALAETLLLLITCVWIIWSAARRILSGRIEIEVNAWSFLVMLVSIAVDFSRSRMLYKAAKQYRSPALEADALHFSTDIWSSAVVILGLLCMKFDQWRPGWDFLHYADAAAAIFVALIVAWVSVQLGRRSLDELLDKAPAGLEDEVKRIAESLPRVVNCHNVRIRASGPSLFIDLHILMEGGQTLPQAHTLTEDIERTIQDRIANADVTVHPEPAPEN